MFNKSEKRKGGEKEEKFKQENENVVYLTVKFIYKIIIL